MKDNILVSKKYLNYTNMNVSTKYKNILCIILCIVIGFERLEVFVRTFSSRAPFMIQFTCDFKLRFQGITQTHTHTYYKSTNC